MGSLTHTDQLFKENSPKIEKSHCFLCHNEIRTPNKSLKGNCCSHCNNRASKVARGIISKRDSDYMLLMRKSDLQVETWIIDGVSYTKYPSGDLCMN